jgi:uncharacterized membrane protein YfcA
VVIDMPDLIAIVVLAFIATTIQTSVGFGAALFFVPSATLLVGAEPSVAAILIVVPGMGAILFSTSSEQTPWRESIWPALISLASMPVGVLLLTRSDENVLRLMVGFGVLVAVVVNYIGEHSVEVIHAPSWPRIMVSGLAAGLMRGSLGMGGPALVLYFHWLGGGATRFRNRMYAYALTAGIPSIAIAAASGLYGGETMKVVGASLPGALLGLLVGVRLRPHISDTGNRRLSVLLLIATSTLAMVTAVSVLF